ncbi:MAG: heptaprenyl diphosphate synthase [Thermobacillus sp. ZCTH02-B1]|uniref:polyprenyl synthetase family protein n=1 Tax=Thermobacillus sp. ZCTH02-B1 TaxID=1858795 RepID=UPI000B55248C|nr:polyprenyl synthetase family protein [Thermobacillus sp. ZCTH02-B1]OUM96785.1 MAG: heptaprenyl diphosphate synthase [Thermobacillus sp. ZCTH02-B1]
MRLTDLYAGLEHDLNIIEQELERSVTSDHALLSEAASHLLKAGGKRIRPAIVLLAGKFGDYRLDVLKKVAVPLELIHMASLVHDDVIDDADTRRGQLTVKSKWDNRVAMYTGDYIYAKALTIIAELSDPLLHQALSRAIVQMCIGEMEQIRDFFNTAQTVRNYLLRIRRKTALLIAISCQLGAAAAGAPPALYNRLYRYGYNIGMAFQIRDDLLDVLGTERQLGKPPGSDIRQGNITLPVLLALRDPEVRDELLGEIAKIRDADGRADCSRAIGLIRASRGIEEAERLAVRYVDKAIGLLDGLPDIPARRTLAELARFVGRRNY